MTYELHIGDESFSICWQRGWLMFDSFDLPVHTRFAGPYSGTLAEDLAPLARHASCR